MIFESCISSSLLSLRVGVQAFAEALLVIPKTLALNSGLDAQECIVKLKEENRASDVPLGLDISTGQFYIPTFPFALGPNHNMYCPVHLVVT